MHHETLSWVIFNVVVLGMLALDLGVFHRKTHSVGLKEALGWSAVWIALAMCFNVYIYFDGGAEQAQQFFTGYVIEKALSVDNLFVFVMIFSYFKVPTQYQHKVLFWGVLGALAMRAFMIFAGIAIINKFHWMIYVLGAFLIYTGFKMLADKDKKLEPEKNPILKAFRRLMPVTEDYEGDRFFVRRNAVLFATPLAVVLLFVEITDLVFAVDSIPAILAITRDPFIVYTSNVFAILGLRSLYFALAAVVHLFHYLVYGLSAILVFIGAKMILLDIYKIPIPVSLGVVVGTLVLCVVASLVFPKKGGHGEAEPEPEAGA